MTCSHARAALSARLDGEDPGPAVARLPGHLAACADCRGWLAAAERLGEMVRGRPAGADRTAPDLTVAVLSRFAAEGAARAARAARGELLLRLAVGLIAAVQLLLALPGVLGLAGAHGNHEAASFGAALAAGFLLAAYRPRLALAYTPVALVLAACLAISGALDVSHGRAGLAHEVAHLVAVAQAGLVWALARRVGAAGRGRAPVDPLPVAPAGTAR